MAVVAPIAQARHGRAEAVVRRHRVRPRAAHELSLGELAPLAEAIPELGLPAIAPQVARPEGFEPPTSGLETYRGRGAWSSYRTAETLSFDVFCALSVSYLERPFPRCCQLTRLSLRPLPSPPQGEQMGPRSLSFRRELAG